MLAPFWILNLNTSKNILIIYSYFTINYTILIWSINIIKKKLLERANLGHGSLYPVSRNRYGVEKTVDTHQILINAIKCYVCLQEI